ncbi:MAG: DUF2203 domain-containing protein [Chloroflexi bacterium]|nr:DUF2203 domain-containing protein [Chloroflexota bacterium]
MHPKHFSWENASAELPWLRQQLGAINAFRQELAGLQRRLQDLLRSIGANGHGISEESIAEARSAVDGAASRLARLAQEVADRGIILRDVERGLIDFPAYREGREVYLCWLLGEDEILYWHELDAGYPGRQRW